MTCENSVNGIGTHSFLFFGPGFPLGFTTPSTSKLALFFPFPFPPSAGGGIATESSVPLGTGVFPLDATSPSARGDAVGALESDSDDVDDDVVLSSAWDGSLFTSVVAATGGSNFARRDGESFRRMMLDLEVAFLERPPPALGVEGEALFALAAMVDAREGCSRLGGGEVG